ncbi:hypothetical protein Agub_g15944, partial [Astrephomene gubernaculifera]
GRSLARLVELWDYEGSLSAEERRKIRGALLREVGRMYRQLALQQGAAAAGGGVAVSYGRGAGPSWEEAFAQVMTAQQQTTAALLDLLAQCQAALDELRFQAGFAGTATAAGGYPYGDGGSMAAGGGGGEVEAAGGGGEGRGGAGARRALLLLREAEAEEERQRAMRREREEVLAEFREAALLRSRRSPARPALKPALKSALKRPTSQSQPHNNQPDGDGGGSSSEAAPVCMDMEGALEDAGPSSSSFPSSSQQQQQPLLQRRGSLSPSSFSRWRSARSSPTPPEVLERLERARKGVVAGPVKRPVTPGPASAAATPAVPEAAGAAAAAGTGTGTAVRARSAPLPYERRAMSVDRARPHQQQHQQQQQRAGSMAGEEEVASE